MIFPFRSYDANNYCIIYHFNTLHKRRCRIIKRIISLFAVLFIFISSFSNVSAAPVSDSDIDPTRPLADFIPSEGVPADVEIPEFYMEVANSMGLYIFMTADGTVYKRIYGSVDGVYGWYVASGTSNTVYADTPMVNIEADKEIYYASPWVIKTDDGLQEYAGILPPEEGIDSLDTILGVPLKNIAFISFGVVAVICIFILGRASSNKKRYRQRRY